VVGRAGRDLGDLAGRAGRGAAGAIGGALKNPKGLAKGIGKAGAGGLAALDLGMVGLEFTRGSDKKQAGALGALGGGALGGALGAAGAGAAAGSIVPGAGTLAGGAIGLAGGVLGATAGDMAGRFAGKKAFDALGKPNIPDMPKPVQKADRTAEKTIDDVMSGDFKLTEPEWLRNFEITAPDWLQDVGIEVPSFLEDGIDFNVPDLLHGGIDVNLPDGPKWPWEKNNGDSNEDSGGNGGSGSGSGGGSGDPIDRRIDAGMDAASGAIDRGTEAVSGAIDTGTDVAGEAIDAGADVLDDRVPGLATGGRVKQAGLARIHSGEEIVETAEVDRTSDRLSEMAASVTSSSTIGDGGGQQNTLDQILAELRRLRSGDASGGGDVTIEQQRIEVGDQSLDIRDLSRGDIQDLADAISKQQGDNLTGM
jgi:hypothetical protein